MVVKEKPRQKKKIQEIVEYLDVTLSLFNSTYKPFSKSKNEFSYIHKESKHPLSKIKQVPFSIEPHLSSLSWMWKLLPNLRIFANKH